MFPPPKFHGTLSSFVLDPLSIFPFQHPFSQGFVAFCSFEGLDCVVYVLGFNLSLLQKDPKRLWLNLIRSLLLIPTTGQRFVVQGWWYLYFIRTFGHTGLFPFCSSPLAVFCICMVEPLFCFSSPARKREEERESPGPATHFPWVRVELQGGWETHSAAAGPSS